MTDNMTTLDPKVLLDKYRDDHEGLVAALEAALPKPTHPEHLFDLWATHPEHGDVICMWDKPNSIGNVLVRWRDERVQLGSCGAFVPVSSLTFPEQTTKPEDVPVGEAWIVNVDDGKRSGERVVALKFYDDHWYTGSDVVGDAYWWLDSEVTLVAPLVPGRPEPQPEPEPEHPRTLSSAEDYEDAPLGTVVAPSGNSPWVKIYEERWTIAWSGARRTNSDMAELEEQYVLRWGWSE
ncbi:hypothetical protein [Corynebacterium qintianiae]|uniref:hypothetical protein n=1 Tax=Corynebacterium qintianiae TaxID=2709392 RepID=UPI0013EDAA72|nr:hypothetical protein [Corynebacterium qintianiae]